MSSWTVPLRGMVMARPHRERPMSETLRIDLYATAPPCPTWCTRDDCEDDGGRFHHAAATVEADEITGEEASVELVRIDVADGTFAGPYVDILWTERGIVSECLSLTPRAAHRYGGAIVAAATSGEPGPSVLVASVSGDEVGVQASIGTAGSLIDITSAEPTGWHPPLIVTLRPAAALRFGQAIVLAAEQADASGSPEAAAWHPSR